jgi:thioredoxin 1
MSLKLLKFGAVWCGPCKSYDSILESFKEDHPEVEIQKVDIEDVSSEVDEMVSKYTIRSVPTTIIIKDGVETKKVGVITKYELETYL